LSHHVDKQKKMSNNQRRKQPLPEVDEVINKTALPK